MSEDVEHVSAVEEAWALISRLHWELKPRMLSVAAEFGLTPPQLFALNMLDPDRPIPMRELATALRCDSSNVTGLVDRLAAQGLVERRDAPNDRRMRMLAVTDQGAHVRSRLRDVMREIPPALARLSPADQRALRDLMRRALTPDGGSAPSISER